MATEKTTTASESKSRRAQPKNYAPLSKWRTSSASCSISMDGGVALSTLTGLFNAASWLDCAALQARESRLPSLYAVVIDASRVVFTMADHEITALAAHVARATRMSRRYQLPGALVVAEPYIAMAERYALTLAFNGSERLVFPTLADAWKWARSPAAGWEPHLHPPFGAEHRE